MTEWQPMLVVTVLYAKQNQHGGRYIANELHRTEHFQFLTVLATR